MKTTLLIACCFVATAAFGQSSLTSDPYYQKNCTHCHGKSGEGHPERGPALTTTKLSVDEIKTIIERGKDKMPGYKGKLTSDRIFALAAEIHDLSK
jgi:mono/diheme cytochrome c family protein